MILRERIEYHVLVFETLVIITFTTLLKIRKYVEFRDNTHIIKIFIDRSKIFLKIRK